MVLKNFRKWLSGFLPAPHRSNIGDAAAFRQRLNQLAILAAADILCMLLLFSWYERWPLVTALAISGVFLVGSPAIYRMNGSILIAREIYLFSLFSFLVYETFYFGTILSPGSLFLPSLPIVAVLAGSISSAIVWVAIVVVSTIVLAATGDMMAPAFIHSVGSANEMKVLYVASLIALVVSLSMFVVLMEYERTLAIRSLGEMNETVRKLALRDPLTGAFNRRYLADLIAADDARPPQARNIQAILMIDIDRFKSINDTFGHLAGDTVIRSVATEIMEQVGSRAIVGRYGGEEFVCIVQARQLQEGVDLEEFSESIRERVSRVEFPDIPTLKNVTVSIGYARCALFNGAPATLAKADAALYAAKEAGRDCVREATPVLVLDPAA